MTTAIRVRIRLFAMQRELAGTRSLEVTLPTGATIEDAWAALVEAHPALAGPFDMAFIDALKPEYGAYLDALLDGRLEPGALVVADNVLWSGRVSGSRSAAPGDGNTAALRAFCERVLGDDRFTATVLPVGDGLLIATWRG